MNVKKGIAFNAPSLVHPRSSSAPDGSGSFVACIYCTGTRLSLLVVPLLRENCANSALGFSRSRLYAPLMPCPVTMKKVLGPEKLESHST